MRPTAWSTTATAANPPHTHRPASHEAACQLASATSPAASAPTTAHCTQSRAAAGIRFQRIRASGLMVRISSSGPSANRSETSTPTPRPWTAAEPVTP